jgi:hypothetical protein
MLVSATRSGAPPEAFTATLLARLFDESANNPERERIMQLWAAAAPHSDGPRRTLITRVYEPLLHQGKGAAKSHLTTSRLSDPLRARQPRTEFAQRSKRVSPEISRSSVEQES